MAKRTWRRRGQQGKWYVRLTVPVRENGVIVRKRKEHRTGCHRKADAEEVADQIEADYFEAARVNQAPDGSDTTFDDAVGLYLGRNPNVEEAKRLAPIVEEIGDLTLDKLTQAEVQRVAQKLKGHCKPNTQARYIYVPISAVYNNAVKAGLAPPRKFEKPKGWNKDKRVKSPPNWWYGAIKPYLRPTLYALLTLNVTHGLRISEAVRRTPADIDTTHWPWRLNLPEYDKAGNPVQVVLAEHVIEAIEAIPNWREQKWLFGTCSKDNINRDIKKACAKAGVDYYGSHAWGRHKAARNYLDAGGSLKGLQDAFRWKDPTVPMRHYGHEERSEIIDRVHQVGGQFFEQVNNLELQNAADGTIGQPGAAVANLWQTPQPGRKNTFKSTG
ncbi:tyrosine-type recombinase/integrase [Dichotomicrobium thermohalophilum]|uniref:Phage integrase family protein n=1 Tax=Dichotomicrobium thermohalophilum TaxID=933063 RepID=A0A397Q4S7_9HYPH|nr:tyrosine-type recombinase/integrase [Dichotomicrobium thermohalophilum]RIA56048.1 phage integrase family protein [Dichotomicrobium thermohalophilum]